jgi:hypothetical protein
MKIVYSTGQIDELAISVAQAANRKKRQNGKRLTNNGSRHFGQ